MKQRSTDGIRRVLVGLAAGTGLLGAMAAWTAVSEEVIAVLGLAGAAALLVVAVAMVRMEWRG